MSRNTLTAPLALSLTICLLATCSAPQQKPAEPAAEAPTSAPSLAERLGAECAAIVTQLPSAPSTHTVAPESTVLIALSATHVGLAGHVPKALEGDPQPALDALVTELAVTKNSGQLVLVADRGVHGALVHQVMGAVGPLMLAVDPVGAGLDIVGPMAVIELEHDQPDPAVRLLFKDGRVGVELIHADRGADATFRTIDTTWLSPGDGGEPDWLEASKLVASHLPDESLSVELVIEVMTPVEALARAATTSQGRDATVSVRMGEVMRSSGLLASSPKLASSSKIESLLGTGGSGSSDFGVTPKKDPGSGTVSGDGPRAGLKPGHPTVDGNLDERIIRKVINQHKREAKACYEEVLGDDPAAAGEVVVRFTIAKTGSVSEAKVEKSTLNERVGSCLAKSITQWTFPAPKGGGEVHVTYPFAFEVRNASPAK